VPKLAIIGAGVMGANHGRVARTVREFTVTAVCDPDTTRAAAVARPLGANYTADIDEAIDGADAVILASPSHTHGDLGERILKHGCDLLIEKPIATSVRDAERLIEVAEANDRVLLVGHIERFNPAVTEIWPLVADPVSLEITRVGPFSSRNLADVFLDLMIHDVDLARSIVGSKIAQHQAAAKIVRTAEFDYACALLQFENGVIANLTASRVSQNKVRRVTLTQRDNVIVADLLRQQVEIHRIESSEFLSESGVRYRQSGLVEIPYLSQHGEPLAHEQRHFAACVERQVKPIVTGEDGLEALKTCLALRDASMAVANV
jgi:UDP-N-acetylglucosamine 3-dehydrogenase